MASKSLSTSEVVQRFISSNGNRYDYSRVNYVNVGTKVEIICDEHGSFWTLPSNHYKGSGCPKCRAANLSRLFTKSRYEVINEFISIHGDKYNYDLVEYINNVTPITLFCKTHGEFQITPHKHKAGGICPQCSKESSYFSRTKTTLKFIEEANEIHNFKYDYSKSVYTFSLSKLIITCSHHGDFEQKASDHVFGKGCPRCTHQVSKSESEWLNSLNIPHLIKGMPLKEKPRRKVDGYDPITNTVYQFHGDYWHGNPKVYPSSTVNKHNGKTMGELFTQTTILDQEIRDLGYNILIMWEYDWILSKRK
jgi:Zn finger protein HypA/HybF involved in hydrogenase expression